MEPGMGYLGLGALVFIVLVFSGTLENLLTKLQPQHRNKGSK